MLETRLQRGKTGKLGKAVKRRRFKDSNLFFMHFLFSDLPGGCRILWRVLASPVLIPSRSPVTRQDRAPERQNRAYHEQCTKLSPNGPFHRYQLLQRILWQAVVRDSRRPDVMIHGHEQMRHGLRVSNRSHLVSDQIQIHFACSQKFNKFKEIERGTVLAVLLTLRV